jgi:hypothetical protein
MSATQIMKRNCDRARELSFDEAELTIALLARFIAERARRIAAARAHRKTINQQRLNEAA